MTNAEIQVLKENYENSLKDKLEGAVYKETEKVDLANIVGSEFVKIIESNQLKFKEFNMKLSKTMNILLFTIVSNKQKLVNVLLSTESISDAMLKINEVQVDFLIDEELLENLCE
jgi:hypothetical protein